MPLFKEEHLTNAYHVTSPNTDQPPSTKSHSSRRRSMTGNFTMGSQRREGAPSATTSFMAKSSGRDPRMPAHHKQQRLLPSQKEISKRKLIFIQPKWLPVKLFTIPQPEWIYQFFRDVLFFYSLKKNLEVCLWYLSVVGRFVFVRDFFYELLVRWRWLIEVVDLHLVRWDARELSKNGISMDVPFPGSPVSIHRVCVVG